MVQDSIMKASLPDLIGDENFISLLRLFQRNQVTWDEYLEHPLPSGISPREMWDILHRIGESYGISLMMSDPNGYPAWYRETFQISQLVEKIIEESARSSTVSTVLLKDIDQYGLRQMWLAESKGAARIDGIEFNEADIDELVATHSEPQTNVERFFNNMVELDETLESYIDTPFSPELCEELLAKLFKGIELDGCGRVASEVNEADTCIKCSDCPSKEENLFELFQGYSHKEPLTLLMEYANDHIGDEYDRPLLRGGSIRYLICEGKYFGHMSAIVASFLSRLYYLKHGMKLIALLPLSLMWSRWENNLALPVEACCSPESYRATLEMSRGECTLYQTLALEMIVASMDEVTQSVSVTLDQAKLLRDVVSKDASFNHRQKAIILRALRVPHAEYKIRYHQRKNEISYATARRDFVELEEKGLLYSEYVGKTMVFYPEEHIADYFE